MRRVFILGNGPSLADHDLSLVAGEETWALNRIHLFYGRTAWRPRRWWFTDHPQIRWQLEEILARVPQEKECWIRSDVCEMLTGSYCPFGKDNLAFLPNLPANVRPWTFCNEHLASRATDANFPKVYHWPSDGSLCKVGTGVSVMIAQAMLEGYDQINLLGCDAHFSPDRHHFDADYLRGHEILSEEYCDMLNARVVGAHKLMSAEAAKRGVAIRSVGEPGALRDIYEHRTLAEALR